MVKLPLDISAQRDDWHVPAWVRLFSTLDINTLLIFIFYPEVLISEASLQPFDSTRPESRPSSTVQTTCKQ